MRGKGQAAPFGAEPVGITPAYAGKRWSTFLSRQEHGDHPRICGEKTVNGTGKVTRLGSPPHMRGKGVSQRPPGAETGIIPAYAGKRNAVRTGLLFRQDHPRICGEKSLLDERRERQVGSPPHMRGKVTPSGGLRSGSGITPAYAGKRAAPGQADRLCQDHPRICGEKEPEPCQRSRN